MDNITLVMIVGGLVIFLSVGVMALVQKQSLEIVTTRMAGALDKLADDQRMANALEKQFFELSKERQMWILFARDAARALANANIPGVDPLADEVAAFMEKVTDGQPNDAPVVQSVEPDVAASG